MTRVLVLTADTIGPRMAGPAIRASNVASVLSQHHDVRLATTGRVDGPSGLAVAGTAVDAAELRRLADWAQVIVLQGWVLADHPDLGRTDRVIVVDAYDPMHLEQLEQGRDAGRHGHLVAVADCTAVLNHQLLRADLVLCASEKQRDFWLGQLAGLGRVNPATYDADPTLRSLIDVVPFGLPADPPTSGDARADADADADRGHRILWGGGIYNWFDPLTLLRAVDELRGAVPDVHLEFLGTTHPSPTIPTMRMAVAARELADELGLTGRWVTFNDGWVPYLDRGRHLAGASVGVTTHLHHVETEFAFRTRVLDYLWARLPIVTTSGDSLAELVADEDLGLVVAPGDVAGLADALRVALTDEERRRRWHANADRVARRYEWPTVLEPLRRFCDSPRRAPDLVDAEVRRHLEPGSRLRPRSGPRAMTARVADALHTEGWAGVGRRIARRLRRGSRDNTSG